jgi:hypothetical protein
MDGRIIGGNYEGGKIITHIRNFNCVAYANCQIVMDAPFEGRVASETVRKIGRSETQFEGYDEKFLKKQIEDIFTYIKNRYHNIKIVIQVARGRAAYSMTCEILQPILNYLEITNYEFIFGYKSDNYFTPKTTDEFIFVNIGMFAVLQNIDFVKVGEIYNPTETINLLEKNDIEIISDDTITVFNDEKNILNNLENIKTFVLFGLSDDMPFITPENYSKENFQKIIDRFF